MIGCLCIYLSQSMCNHVGLQLQVSNLLLVIYTFGTSICYISFDNFLLDVPYDFYSLQKTLAFFLKGSS